MGPEDIVFKSTRTRGGVANRTRDLRKPFYAKKLVFVVQKNPIRTGQGRFAKHAVSESNMPQALDMIGRFLELGSPERAVATNIFPNFILKNSRETVHHQRFT
jgi:hypothetical protein